MSLIGDFILPDCVCKFGDTLLSRGNCALKQLTATNIMPGAELTVPQFQYKEPPFVENRLRTFEENLVWIQFIKEFKKCYLETINNTHEFYARLRGDENYKIGQRNLVSRDRYSVYDFLKSALYIVNIISKINITIYQYVYLMIETYLPPTK